MFCTYRLLYSWNEPPSSNRIFANKTAFKNGTSTNSSKFNSTENLYFFFFIMNAIPGAPGPIKVIQIKKNILSLCRFRLGSVNRPIKQSVDIFYCSCCVCISSFISQKIIDFVGIARNLFAQVEVGTKLCACCRWNIKLKLNVPVEFARTYRFRPLQPVTAYKLQPK